MKHDGLPFQISVHQVQPECQLKGLVERVNQALFPLKSIHHNSHQILQLHSVQQPFHRFGIGNPTDQIHDSDL